MSKYIPGNQKHLTLNDRIYIENELSKGATFKDIAAFLCKDPTTISKEVKSRRLSDWYHKGTFYNAKNFCVHRYHCKKTNACGKIMLCGIKCTSCPTCNQTCKDFEKERCCRLDKAPYVCNGCPMKINHCTIAHKYRYDARFADRKYRELLSSSRAGINMTRHQLHQKDQIVTPLIAQGQSPYQILINHPELDMPVRSMYTYIDKGLFTARNVGLKRQAKVPQNTDQRPQSVYQQNLCRLLFYGIRFLCTNGYSKVIKGLPENAVNHDLYRGKTVSCISY